MTLPPLKLQLHWLTSYPCALLNRDDNGDPKGLYYGGARRHRASDAAQKHAWKAAHGHPHALLDGFEASQQSQAMLRLRIAEPLVAEGHDPKRVIAVLETFLNALKGKKKQGDIPDDADTTGPENPLVVLDRKEGLRLGPREIEYLDRETRDLLRETAGGAAALRTAAQARLAEIRSALEAIPAAAGIDSALFGRHVFGDLATRMDSALNLAHLMTVHAANTEIDYKTTTDDLLGIKELGHSGAANVQQPRLSGGVFYGYLTVDIPTLIKNLSGADDAHAAQAPRDVAATLVERLIHLAATQGPRARVTQTASHARADFVLLELTTGCPRSLMKAFETPCTANLRDAARRLAQTITAEDAMHGVEALRACATTTDCAIPHAQPGSLAELAATAGRAVREPDRVAAALAPQPAEPIALW